MESENVVGDSLKEIAALLVLLHEKYLKDVTGCDILFGLLSFLQDVRLLDTVTIVNAEKWRRVAMSHSNQTYFDATMNYEKFFEWLRQLAQFICCGETGSSLHQFLIRYIIPLAAAEGGSNSQQQFALRLNKYKLIKRYFVDAVWDVCIEYQGFLSLWFVRLHLGDGFHLTPLENWRLEIVDQLKSRTVLTQKSLLGSMYISQFEASATLGSFVDSVAASGVDSAIFGSRQFHEFSRQVLDSSGRIMDLREAEISSTDFYVLLVYTANSLFAGSPNSVEQLVAKLAQVLFDETLRSFAIRASPTRVGVNSILWWCRQTGLMQLSGITFSSILDTLLQIMRIDDKIDATPELLLGLSVVSAEILSVFSTLLSSIVSIVEIDRSPPLHERPLETIASWFPALLFSSALCVPSMLGELYTVENRDFLNSASFNLAMNTVVSICRRELESNVCRLSLELFLEHCEGCMIIPKIISKAVMLKSIEFVLRTPFDSEQFVSPGDLQEIIFVLSQICFEDVELTVTKEKLVVNMAIEKFERFLRCFTVAGFVACMADGESMPDERDFEKERELVNHNSSEKKPVQPIKVHETDAYKSQRDVVVMLIHYPINSFRLNPWEIMQIFLSKTKTQRHQGLGKPVDHSRGVLGEESQQCLTEILREFCHQYDISTEELGEYFEQFYGSPQCDSEESVEKSLRPTVASALSSVLLDYILRDRTLRLLYANAELLRWEYCRCTIRNRSTDPFTEGVDVPMPTAEAIAGSPMDTQMTALSALSWAAKTANLSEIEASSYLRETMILSGHPETEGPTAVTLTFSTFVVFAIRCFTTKSLPKSLIEDSPSKQEEFLDQLKLMLQRFSDNLTRVQQNLKIRLLKPLVGMERDPMRDVVEIIDVQSLLMSLCEMFAKRFIGVPNSADVTHLPPRPPLSLWDAPRFVEFCKFCGVLNYLESALPSWNGFGEQFRTSSSASGSSDAKLTRRGESRNVPPLPLKVSPQIVYQLLEKSAVEASAFGKLDSYLHGLSVFQYMFTQVILPMGASLVDTEQDDDSLDSKRVMDCKMYSSRSLEDLLRFGGDRMMLSSMEHRHWIRDTFSTLAENNKGELTDEYREASLSTVCRFLSCRGLLRAGVVAVQAKRSLHPRFRPFGAAIQVGGTTAVVRDVTLSKMEFEELVLRCAFTMFELSCAISGEPDLKSLLAQAMDKPGVKPLGKQLKAAEVYLAEVGQHIDVPLSSNVTQSERYRGYWGKDFLTPYIQTLKECCPLPSQSSRGRPAKSNSFDVVSNLDNDKLDSESASTDTGLSRKVTLMVDQPSSEPNGADAPLLSAILATRFHHSIADPVMRDAKQDLMFPQIATSHDKKLKPFHDSKDDSRHFSGNSSFTLHDLAFSSGGAIPRIPSIKEVEVMEPFSDLLEGTKEALWPVYATYCSCGDSTEPGKLSGPNLFSLLSKLGILTDQTVLSDVGILLHQISAHSHAQSPLALAMMSPDDVFESPSLTFEEFLVFLCAFSQLRFEGIIASAPMFGPRGEEKMYEEFEILSHRRAGSRRNVAADLWYCQWEQHMTNSAPFHRLLQEFVLPILRRHPLLAFPEDARHRDRLNSVFSLEVLLAVEGAEGPLKGAFDRQQARHRQQDASEGSEVTSIMVALRKINLVPQIISEGQVLQLVRDVLPETSSKRDQRRECVRFPQWEWVLCVVAFEAVDIAVKESVTLTPPEKIPTLVADIISSIAAAMKHV